MNRKNILFLHTELAGYFLACLDALSELYDTDIHVIKLPVNKEAPFNFSYQDTIHFYDRNNYSEKELMNLCKKISPDFIFCAGWIDKSYLKVCKHFFKKIPTVIVLDNHWTGSLKQQIAALASPAVLLQRFSNIWIPGLFQYEYARRLGFKRDAIITGMYSADVNKFHAFYQEFKENKFKKFPKRFLYVGRYIDAKGVKELWEVFLELQEEGNSDWELWCAGTGNLESVFPTHPNIKNFGFIQPEELHTLIKDAGVFILPSHKEPWGVVVHEFAACGMPLICSNEVGAASTFLINGYNGFTFKSQNKIELKKVMLRMMHLEKEAFKLMSERSRILSEIINPTIWASKIWELAISYKS
jgi:glycosyltransferase involved in cell wall biosynthesis